MTLVNERNRKLNSTNIRKAEIKFKSTAAQQQSDGDPFSFENRHKNVLSRFN